jgi:drug/metabolite transporter (DMT)-like permease
MIRQSLSGISREEKIAVGKDLLRNLLRDRRRVTLAELNFTTMSKRLVERGYPPLEESFIQIAEGRLSPQEIDEAMFEALPAERRRAGPQRKFVLTCKLPAINRRTLVEILQFYRVLSIRIRQKGDVLSYRITLMLNDEERAMFIKILEQTPSVRDKRMRSYRTVWVLRIAKLLLTVQWGLDPVFAKFLINHGVEPLTFTFIRAWTSFTFAMLLVLLVNPKRMLSRIPLRHASLWITGIAFFVGSMFTYFALEDSSPFFYKTMLRVSALLLAIPMLVRSRNMSQLLSAAIVAIGGLALLSQSALSNYSLLLALGMVVSFVIYTEASARFQKTAHISLRYPQFFLAMTAIAAGCSVVIPLMGHLHWPSPPLALEVIGFSVFFVSLPYILFYWLMRTSDYLSLAPLFHLSIIVTFIAQWATLGTTDLLVMPAAALLIASSVIASGKRRAEIA